MEKTSCKALVSNTAPVAVGVSSRSTVGSTPVAVGVSWGRRGITQLRCSRGGFFNLAKIWQRRRCVDERAAVSVWMIAFLSIATIAALSLMQETRQARAIQSQVHATAETMSRAAVNSAQLNQNGELVLDEQRSRDAINTIAAKLKSNGETLEWKLEITGNTATVWVTAVAPEGLLSRQYNAVSTRSVGFGASQPGN